MSFFLSDREVVYCLSNEVRDIAFKQHQYFPVIHAAKQFASIQEVNVTASIGVINIIISDDIQLTWVNNPRENLSTAAYSIYTIKYKIRLSVRVSVL